jgi:hypothetical protein
MGALSAITSTTVSKRTVFGNERVVMGYITLGDGTNTWPSGGLAFGASNLGIGGIDFIQFEQKSLQYYYDYTNAKIDGYLCGTAGSTNVQVQAGAATPASAELVHFIAIGHGKG